MSKLHALTGLAMLSAVSINGAVDANDRRYTGPVEWRHALGVSVIDHTDPAFRNAHPVRVHVVLEDDKSPDHVLRFDERTMAELQRDLPANVILTSSPQYADMHVRAALMNYDLRFEITDTDRKDKSYKKSRSHAGQCGTYKKAWYTRLKERGTSYADYQVSSKIIGFRPITIPLQVSAFETFERGTDLIASSSRCATGPTDQMPSDGVEKLFIHSSPAYRHDIASDIHRKTASALGESLAQHVLAEANRYYVTLAYELTQRMSYTQNPVPYPEPRGPRDHWDNGNRNR